MNHDEKDAQVRAEIKRRFGKETSRLPSTDRMIRKAYSPCNYCKKYGHEESECKEKPRKLTWEELHK